MNRLVISDLTPDVFALLQLRAVQSGTWYLSIVDKDGKEVHAMRVRA